MENYFSLKKYKIAFAYISIQFLLTMETMKLQIAKNLLKCKRSKKGSKSFEIQMKSLSSYTTIHVLQYECGIIAIQYFRL